MAPNPVAYTENVVRSFLRHQLTAYPFKDVAEDAVAVAAELVEVIGSGPPSRRLRRGAGAVGSARRDA